MSTNHDLLNCQAISSDESNNVSASTSSSQQNTKVTTNPAVATAATNATSNNAHLDQSACTANNAGAEILNSKSTATESSEAPDTNVRLPGVKDSSDTQNSTSVTQSSHTPSSKLVNGVSSPAKNPNSSASSSSNPPTSMAKKATKFEIISVQELDGDDEVDDGEESGDDAEDSVTELNSSQSRGDSFSNDDNAGGGPAVGKDPSLFAPSAATSNRKVQENKPLQKMSLPGFNHMGSLVDVSKAANKQQASAHLKNQDSFCAVSGVVMNHYNQVMSMSRDLAAGGGVVQAHTNFYTRANSDEVPMPASVVSAMISASYSNMNSATRQPQISANPTLAKIHQHSVDSSSGIATVPGVIGVLQSIPNQTSLDDSSGFLMSSVTAQLGNQMNNTQHHSNLTQVLSGVGPPSLSSTANLSSGANQPFTSNPVNGNLSHTSQPPSHILPSRFRVVKKVKPFAGKKGRWECKDVPCDVIMRNASGNPGAMSNHATLAGTQSTFNGTNSPEQMYTSNAVAAVFRIPQQVTSSNCNASFAITEDITSSNKNPVHVPLVSHVTSSGNHNPQTMRDQGFQPIKDNPSGVDFNTAGKSSFPIASLDEVLSSVVTSEAIMAKSDEQNSNTLQGQQNPNNKWDRMSSVESFRNFRDAYRYYRDSCGNGDVTSLLGNQRCGTGESDDGSSSENGAVDGVTRKLVQVMEVVKSHVVMTVQEEFEVMKSELEDLKTRNMQLEAENSFFRQKQMNENSNKKRDVSVQVAIAPSNQEVAVNAAKRDKYEENKDTVQLGAFNSNFAGLNLPYVVLGIGNPGVSNVGFGYPQQMGMGNQGGVDLQSLQRQQQTPMGFFPMSILQNTNILGSSGLMGPIQSGNSEEQNQFTNAMQGIDNSGTATNMNLSQGSASFSKTGSDSGRSSLEPQRERNQSTDDSSLGSSQAGYQQQLQYSSLNFSQPVQKPAPATHSSVTNSSSGMSHSNNNSSSSSTDLQLLANQQTSGMSSQAQIVQPSFNMGNSQNVFFSGQPLPQAQQQQVFYMPQMAYHPMQSAPAVSFPMMTQFPQTGMYVPAQNMGSQLQAMGPSPQQIQQSGVPQGSIPGLPQGSMAGYSQGFVQGVAQGTLQANNGPSFSQPVMTTGLNFVGNGAGMSTAMFLQQPTAQNAVNNFLNAASQQQHNMGGQMRGQSVGHNTSISSVESNAQESKKQSIAGINGNAFPANATGYNSAGSVPLTGGMPGSSSNFAPAQVFNSGPAHLPNS